MKKLTEMTIAKIDEKLDQRELWEKFEQLKDEIGAEALCDEIAQALSTDELESKLRFIDKNNDTNIF